MFSFNVKYFFRHCVVYQKTPPPISDLNDVTGKLFSNMEVRPVEGEATDKVLAKKFFLIDEYWTGLKTKEEIIKT